MPSNLALYEVPICGKYAHNLKSAYGHPILLGSYFGRSHLFGILSGARLLANCMIYAQFNKLYFMGLFIGL